MGLARYHKKRDFAKTPEPRGRAKRAKAKDLSFVVHEHDATRLHYDLRLELDGVLKSWAVPKGPSLDPSEKRLAVHVEDHPLDYGKFEGVIPEGQYGGGPVIVWDRGTWSPHGDPHASYRAGQLGFDLHGEKLHGSWALVRMRGRNGNDRAWLLIKKDDKAARTGPAAAVTERRTRSVVSGRRVGDLVKKPSPGRAKTAARAAAPRPRARAQAAPTRRTKAARGSTAAGRRTPIPARLSCALATLVKTAPEGDDWVHEIKYDGYRILCRLEDGRARLVSRNGKDWTRRYPEVATAAADLPISDTVLDGEVVWIRPDGITSFQALQRAGTASAEGELRYYAFDLLHVEGRDVTALPLLERKQALERLLRDAPSPLVYSRHVRGQGPRFLAEACRRGLEGIVSKRGDAPYRGRRTRDWLKVRCGARQEMVLGGYALHAKDRRAVGALLLGIHDEEGRLRYAGRVGTGFTESSRRELKRTLDAHPRSESPFTDPVDDRGDVRFVAPVLVAEVAFTEWTSDGRLRHPSFLGLREDKRARDVVREATARARDGKTRRAHAGKAPAKRTADDPAPGRAAEREVVVQGTRLTNPGKVLWPEVGITKQDLAAYFEAVADRMLPLVEGRPVMLMRCPDGRERGCFYQKHLEGPAPKGLRSVQITESKTRRAYATVTSAEGLVALAQMGALELHVWGSRADRLEHPDRIVFDLDPAPDVPFKDVVSAARDLRDRLKRLGLTSFPATTGGKGLHVHVPIERVHPWEDVRAFARQVADRLVEDEPDRFVATASKAKRKGRIFVDWLRNLRGATAVAPYSPRAREGATVATPLAWDEVTGRLRPERWTVKTVPKRVAGRAADPWRGYGRAGGRLAPAVARLEKDSRG